MIYTYISNDDFIFIVPSNFIMACPIKGQPVSDFGQFLGIVPYLGKKFLTYCGVEYFLRICMKLLSCPVLQPRQAFTAHSVHFPVTCRRSVNYPDCKCRPHAEKKSRPHLHTYIHTSNVTLTCAYFMDFRISITIRGRPSRVCVCLSVCTLFFCINWECRTILSVANRRLLLFRCMYLRLRDARQLMCPHIMCIYMYGGS